MQQIAEQGRPLPGKITGDRLRFEIGQEIERRGLTKIEVTNESSVPVMTLDAVLAGERVQPQVIIMLVTWLRMSVQEPSKHQTPRPVPAVSAEAPNMITVKARPGEPLVIIVRLE